MDLHEGIPFFIASGAYFVVAVLLYFGYTYLAFALLALAMLLTLWLFWDIIVDTFRHPGAFPNTGSPNEY